MATNKHDGKRAALRAQAVQERLTLDETARAAAAHNLAETLLAARDWAGRTIGVYAAIDGEIDLSVFLQAVHPETTFAWPLCHARGIMEFHTATIDALTPGKFGILAPKNSPLLAPEALDAMLIPGSAFSLNGGRLGMGGGYYDRYLLRVRDDIPRIGVAYHWQIRERLPLLPHDIPMTHLATDRGWFPCTTP